MDEERFVEPASVDSKIENKDPNSEMSAEKLEAAFMKSKYPMAGLSGHSAFLQKKLAKGQKYFDSGDYQMARQSSGITKGRQPQAAPFFNYATGDAIPTPESVPVRKTSIIQPKFHAPPPTSPPPSATPQPHSVSNQSS